MGIKAYKGFNADMTCRGFQFKEGETYTEEKAELCNSGFHACEDPIDCLGYYSPADNAVFHEVELDEVSAERKNDTKICGKKIKIGATVEIDEMINASVRLSLERTKNSPNTSSGDYSKAASSGDYSKAVSSGDYSTAASSGDCSTAASSGDYSKASAVGDNTIAAAIGRNSCVKGDIGTWIIATEYGDWDGECYPVVGVVSVKIDGEILKPNTWYTAKGGRFVKAEE